MLFKECVNDLILEARGGIIIGRVLANMQNFTVLTFLSGGRLSNTELASTEAGWRRRGGTSQKM